MERQHVRRLLCGCRIVLSFVFGCMFAITTGCDSPGRIGLSGVVFLFCHGLHATGLMSDTTAVALVSLALSSMTLSAAAAWHVANVFMIAPFVYLGLRSVPNAIGVIFICFLTLFFLFASIPIDNRSPMLSWVVTQGYVSWRTMTVYEVVVRQTLLWCALVIVSILIGKIWQAAPSHRSESHSECESK